MAIKRTSHRLGDRDRRNLDMIETIRRSKTTTKTDLSRDTGYNIVTVSNYITTYIKKGFVYERGLDSSTGGRRPELVEINKKYAYTIGIDTGEADVESRIIGTLIDFSNKIVLKIKDPRPTENVSQTLERAVKMVGKIVEEAAKMEIKDIKGLGIGISGVLHEDTGTVRNHQSGSIADYNPAMNTIENKFGFPAYLANDATVAVLAEKSFFRYEGMRNIIYMYGDQGCGLIINDELYEGSSGSAGEMVIFGTGGVNYKYGDCACKFVSNPGTDFGVMQEIQNLAEAKSAELASSGIVKALGPDLKGLSIEKIAEIAKKGDGLCKKLLKGAGEQLGIKVAYLVNLLNPDMIIIGGGFEKAGDAFIGPVKETVNTWAADEAAKTVRIMPSQAGEDVVALGAACIAMREVILSEL